MHLLTVHKSGFWRVLDRPAIALTVLRHMTDRLRRIRLHPAYE